MPQSQHNLFESDLIRGSLGIYAVQLTHQLGQISPARLEHEVVVVVHEAIGEDTGVEALEGLRDDTQQRLAVGVILKDGLAAVSARRYMIDSAGKLDS